MSIGDPGRPATGECPLLLATLAVLAPGRGRLPEGMQRCHLLGLGLLGGMGFTMSILSPGWVLPISRNSR